MENLEFLNSIKQISTERQLHGLVMDRIARKRGEKFMIENAGEHLASVTVEQLDRLIEMAEKGLKKS